MTRAIIWFLVIGALCAGTAGVVLIITRWSESGRERIATMLGGSEYWLAFAAATGMMLGSLYMSEIADFIPCQFCWYQRICAYPIVAIMFFAALRKDRNAWAATMTLALSGMALGLYHVGLEQGIVGGDGSCDPAAPCTINWLDSQGVPTVITIPRIAFCTFLFILGLGLHATARRPDPAPSTED